MDRVLKYTACDFLFSMMKVNVVHVNPSMSVICSLKHSQHTGTDRLNPIHLYADELTGPSINCLLKRLGLIC